MVQTAGPHIANGNTFTNKSSCIHARGFFLQFYRLALQHCHRSYCRRESRFEVLRLVQILWGYIVLWLDGCLVVGRWGSIQRMMMIFWNFAFFRAIAISDFFVLLYSVVLFYCGALHSIFGSISIYMKRLYVCKCWFLCWFLCVLLCFVFMHASMDIE